MRDAPITVGDAVRVVRHPLDGIPVGAIGVVVARRGTRIIVRWERWGERTHTGMSEPAGARAASRRLREFNALWRRRSPGLERADA